MNTRTSTQVKTWQPTSMQGTYRHRNGRLYFRTRLILDILDEKLLR